MTSGHGVERDLVTLNKITRTTLNSIIKYTTWLKV